jgi:hypothetical protein
MLLLVLFGCSKPTPPADCDAFATDYAAKLSSPADGDLTKKAIELDVRTYKSLCRSDKWSLALASCFAKAPKDSNVLESCASEFSPDQSKHVSELRQQQVDQVRRAVRDGVGAP